MRRALAWVRRRALPWVLGGGAAVFWAIAYIYITLPDVRPLAATNPPTTAFIELRADAARRAGRRPSRDQRWVRYERISPNLRRAVLVAEDDRFWEHRGIDLKQIRASFETNVARGRMARGGSTITQQLAKNLYLSPSKDPVRKLRELFIARRLEAELPKRRILELYLNVIEWGNGIYGAEAAARRYFRRPASTLSASESALLAAAVVNARVLNPARPSARLRWRQRLILRRMGEGVLASSPAPELPAGEASQPEAPANLVPLDPALLFEPGDEEGVEPPDEAIEPEEPPSR
jgi:monofunctional biosynthetic peptidoglycan transglycosylase